jgi:hypothetical protein
VVKAWKELQLGIGTDDEFTYVEMEKEMKIKKEDKEMKKSISKRLAYIGAGIGLALYAVFGLMYGSLLGGVVGMNIVHAIFGSAMTYAIVPRIIVALGMLTGVMAVGTVFVVGSAALGWVIGFVIDPATWHRTEHLKEHGVRH